MCSMLGSFRLVTMLMYVGVKLPEHTGMPPFFISQRENVCIITLMLKY